jgi:hypothetical protein
LGGEEGSRQRKKKSKEEAIEELVAVVEELHMKTHLGYRALSRSLGVSLPSLKRWRKRMQENAPLVQRSGPSKVGALNLCALESEVRALCHGRKRTPGSGALYRKYAPLLSRREFLEIVERCRREYVQKQRRELTRIVWQVPGVVFALDETEFSEWQRMEKAYVLCSMDLASHYMFEVRMDLEMATGESVAEMLRDVFEAHGAPLFLKRDNGSSMNAACVNKVLEEYHVLPLNSPPYYSPYNGGIERAHQDIHAALEQNFRQMGGVLRGKSLELYANNGIQELNHKLRRSLGGRIPCQVFHAKNRRNYGKQQRRVIYEWLKEQTAAILNGTEAGKSLPYEAAYRVAVQTWLEKQGIIRVQKPNRSVTHFSPKLVS